RGTKNGPQGPVLRNDIAGDKVLPVPEVVDKPSRVPEEDELLKSHPDVFSVSVLTRSQARKLEEVTLSETVLGSVLTGDREPAVSPSKPALDEQGLTTLSEVLPLPVSRECLSHAQEKDESLAKCFKEVSELTNNKKAHRFYLEDGLLLRKWVSRPALQQEGGDEGWGVVRQIVIPRDYRSGILQLAHEHPWSGHLGITKTYDRVLQHFFWPGLKKDVAKFCKTCQVCQIVGKPNQTVPPAPLKPIPVVGEPFERVLVDCVGPLPRTKAGNQFLLTIMCATTRFPEAIPLRKITAPTVIKALLKFFSTFGLPRVVQTDQGSNFQSKLFKQTLQSLGIKHIPSSPYHPQSQGALERWEQVKVMECYVKLHTKKPTMSINVTVQKGV
uniref:Gypsy retrotransposon integrase-like protein 1 n=1 Tax=Oreochromis niloticus TaxID=8128 RepID=A0A669DG53_ORENI